MQATVQTGKDIEMLSRMRVYIDKTSRPTTPYDIRIEEIEALWHMAEVDPYHAITLAFDYGQAKATRAAKKARRVHHE